MKKMCRKVVSLLLAAVMVLTMTAFASVVYAADEDSVEADPNFKMGVILVGDETEGYSAAHIAGVKEAAKELGLDDSQIIWKYKVPEDSSCYDAPSSEAAERSIPAGISAPFGDEYFIKNFFIRDFIVPSETVHYFVYVVSAGSVAGISKRIGCVQ